MTDKLLTQVVSLAARCIMTDDRFGTAARAGLLAMALLPSAAVAAPIELKLAFFPAEDTAVYAAAVKPFVDAVNSEGKDLLTIKVYPNGALGKAVAEQPKMALDGIADIAWVVPGQTPYRFPDNQLLEMPGLFHNLREGTLTYTRLIAAKALRGYDDFVVIGAFTTGPALIHSRKPTGSLAALKGQKIRANNQIEAEALARLGAIPTVMPVSRLADAMRRGAIDGAVLPPMALLDFRVAPTVKAHYLLRGGVIPLVLVMNRKKFDSLPAATQALIHKYSGERAATVWIKSYGTAEQHMFETISSGHDHTAIEPSPADRAAARQVYQKIINAWAAKSQHNRELLKTIGTELATIRSTAQ